MELVFKKNSREAAFEALLGTEFYLDGCDIVHRGKHNTVGYLRGSNAGEITGAVLYETHKKQLNKYFKKLVAR